MSPFVRRRREAALPRASLACTLSLTRSPAIRPASVAKRPAAPGRAEAFRARRCRVFFAGGRVGPQGRATSGGEQMPTTSAMTKDQLYREAKRLGIKGRSKMRKGALKAAIERRRAH